MPYDIGPVEGPHLGARRLLLLADYLEQQPPESYFQGYWRAAAERCGTIHCAFGHAVEGLGDVLGIRWSSEDVEDGLICRLDGSTATDPRGNNNLELAAEVFELAFVEADRLFGSRGVQHLLHHNITGRSQLTPQLVAQSLRAFAIKKMEEVHAV